MEITKTGIQEGLKLEKAYTFFMVPFYYESDVDFKKVNLWEMDMDKVSDEGEDGDVLYSYIMDFLQGQMKGSSDIKEHLEIYKMAVAQESAWYKDFWEPFVSHANAAHIPVGKNNSGEDLYHPIAFNILSNNEQGFKAPHLFVYKTAKIGILTFCVELADSKKNISYLKLLNYHLHKIHKPTCRCVCSKLSINVKRRFADENERIAVESKFKEIRNYIAPHDESENVSTYKDFTWNTKGLVDLFLKDIDCSLFSNIRMHVFTYCQINDTEEEKLFKEDLLPDLIRLSRCVNDKYMLPFDNLEKTGATLQCFDNIYYASSVEGTAILAVAKKSNAGFISQLDGNVRLRYLWIYMLAIIQRYALLNMNRQLMLLVSVNDEPKLWDLINTIKEVKTRCYYTDVSPYTQHSQFYQLCCRNLHIREAFNEIEEKAQAQNMTMSHEMQQLLEEQKAASEARRQEDLKREKEQIERDKQQEKALRKAEQKAESGQHRLNLVVGILTVFQVAGVIYDFTNYKWYQCYATLFTFFIGFFLLYIVMSWDNESNRVIKWTHHIWKAILGSNKK